MKVRDLVFLLIGGFLVVIGMLLNSILIIDVNAQDDSQVLTVKEIRCKRLVVGDGDHQLSVFNGYMQCDGIVVKKSITLVDDKFNFRGKFGLDTGRNANLKIYGDDGRATVAYLGLNKEKNGEMVLDIRSKSKTDKRSVTIGINNNGGGVDISNKSGESVSLCDKFRNKR